MGRHASTNIRSRQEQLFGTDANTTATLVSMEGEQVEDAPAGQPLPLDHRPLRRPLELFIDMAREGQKLRPPLKYPAGLKPYMKMSRLPASALGPVRRIVEA